MLTNEFLRANFAYENHGMLRYLNPKREPYPWKPIGKGYLACSIGVTKYYLHRLIWQMHTGLVPIRIDHIDGDKSNNRIANLRECINAENQYNSKRKTTNKSGVKGVVFHAPCTGKPWHAKIVFRSKTISLGYYAEKADAAKAYAAAATKYAREFAKPDVDAVLLKINTPVEKE